MRRVGLVIAVILSSSFVSFFPGHAAAAVSIGINLSFRDSLAPYGDWVRHERFGMVWAPRRVEHGWRPYTHGRWTYTDYDWTWASDEEWGWATDHYGRWYLDPAEGWVWIQGDEWAPAWVAWRNGGGYVGWAPLPPDVDAFQDDFDYRIDPFAYSFVEERRFLEPSIYRAFVPMARNATYVSLTLNTTRYGRVNDRIINRGFDVQRYERVTGRSVPRGRIRDVTSSVEARGGRVQGGQVAVFRPRVEAAAQNPEPAARVTRPAPQGDVAHRQQQEKQRLDSAEQNDRNQLRRIQQGEDRRPPQIPDADAARSRQEAEARSQQDAASRHAQAAARSQQPRPATVDREALRVRHEAEQKAQADHEQRERQMLEQRHQRDRPAPAAAAARPPDHKHNAKQRDEEQQDDKPKGKPKQP